MLKFWHIETQALIISRVETCQRYSVLHWTVLCFLSAPSQKDTLACWQNSEETGLCENHLCSSSLVIRETALKVTAVTHANQKQSSCAKRCGLEQSDSTTITLQLCAGNNCLCDLAGISVILGNVEALMFGFIIRMCPLRWDLVL